MKTGGPSSQNKGLQSSQAAIRPDRRPRSRQEAPGQTGGPSPDGKSQPGRETLPPRREALCLDGRILKTGGPRSRQEALLPDERPRSRRETLVQTSNTSPDGKPCA